jgi:acetyltransferase-like isoleucine patch superfamily enzyme
MRFNIFKTVYYNFRCLPFKQAIRLPVWIGKNVKIQKMGKIILQGKIQPVMVEIGLRNTHGKYKAKGYFSNDGVIKVKEHFRIDTGGVFINSSNIYVHNNVFASDSYIDIHNGNLIIGNGTRLAAGVTIMNDDSHFIMDTKTGKVNRCFSDIVIGDYCWLGRNVFIAKNTVLPNYTIVSAYTVVNKDFSEASQNIVIAGSPAKVVATNKRRIFNLGKQEQIKKQFLETQEKHIFIDLETNDIEQLTTRDLPYNLLCYLTHKI